MSIFQHSTYDGTRHWNVIISIGMATNEEKSPFVKEIAAAGSPLNDNYFIDGLLPQLFPGLYEHPPGTSQLPFKEPLSLLLYPSDLDTLVAALFPRIDRPRERIIHGMGR